MIVIGEKLIGCRALLATSLDVTHLRHVLLFAFHKGRALVSFLHATIQGWRRSPCYGQWQCRAPRDRWPCYFSSSAISACPDAAATSMAVSRFLLRSVRSARACRSALTASVRPSWAAVIS